MNPIVQNTSKYRIEDVLTHTDLESFRKYPFFFCTDYYLTLSKTIKETDPDKHIFFSLIQFERDFNVLTTLRERFSSHAADDFPHYFRYLIYHNNSTSPISFHPQSSTVEEDTTAIRNQIQSLFESAKDEFFEDGMETPFSNNLEMIILKHHELSILALAKALFDKSANEEIVSEALRILGRIRDHDTYNIRLWLLEQNLKRDSVRIKDGALLGLASLDDARCIPSLKRAIHEEINSELREDMQQLLRHLETPLQCH